MMLARAGGRWTTEDVRRLQLGRSELIPTDLLASWGIDQVPVGDAGWATVRARQLLPDPVQAEEFPLLTNELVEGEPLQSYVADADTVRLTKAEMQEDTIVVTFVLDRAGQEAGEIAAACPPERCHWWSFEARAKGEAVLTGEAGAMPPAGGE